jgi:hypothetical protein
VFVDVVLYFFTTIFLGGNMSSRGKTENSLFFDIEGIS